MDSKDFAIKISTRPVEERLKARNKLDSFIETGKGSNGQTLTGAQIEQYRILSRWLNLTLLSPVHSTEQVFIQMEKRAHNR